MSALIYPDSPATWQELETRVAQILREAEYEVEAPKTVPLARGEVNVDVWAVDATSPPNIFVIECKNWARAATRNVVHAFRAVVGDSGANTGLLISSAGFQAGAIEAARYSNVRLLDWIQFQEMFAERWLQRYVAPRLREEGEALIEYTEPINSRIFRKADALSAERQQRFEALRERHQMLGFAFFPLFMEIPGKTKGPVILNLPLRAVTRAELASQLPSEVLDAPALRPLLDALTESYRTAIAEFDDVFGERA